jgi:aminopeptidase YwaD
MDKNAIQSTGLKTLLCILILLFSFTMIGARPAQAGPTPGPTATPTATPTPIPTLAPLPQPAPAAFDQKVVARLSADRAVKHVAYLSETIGPRIAGMEGERQGADYIASVLESLEYEVEMQAFPVPDQYIGSVELPSGAQLKMTAAQNGLITGDEFVSGELIPVTGGLGRSDFPSETAGAIVLMEREQGRGRYRTQVSNAEAEGAIGVILFNPIRFPGDYGGIWKADINTTDIPVLGATWNQGEWLNDMRDQGPVDLRVQTKHYENLESVNVIGIKPAKNGDLAAGAVLVIAHLDSVISSPGANDNASGVGLALELARILRDYNTDKELRFVLFGSEEPAPWLLGSRYYVDQLQPAELDRIVGVFDADMVAPTDSKTDQLYAATVDGLSNLVTDVAEAAGARLGNSSLFPASFGNSDHTPFHNRGVPAALFGMGRASVDYLDGRYHTSLDTVSENISVERMQNSLDIVGAAVFDLIRKEVPALDRSRVRATRMEQAHSSDPEL